MRHSPPVPARAWAALIVGSSTVVLVILDAGFTALAFSEIEADFAETSRTTIGWVASAYFVALSSFMLVAGWLGDRVGRRRVFFAGLLVFAVGALLTATSVTPSMLITARVVQGVGAAALTPVSLAMVLPAFPRERRAQAVGAWGVAGAVSGILAPVLGAVLIDAFGWRAPFLLFAPLAAVVWLVGRRVLLEPARGEPEGPVDLVSIAAVTVTIGAVAIAVTQGEDWGWTEPRTLAFGLVGLTAVPLVVRRSATHAGSPLDLDLFRVRSYSSATLVSFLGQAAFFSFFFSTPVFLIDVWGWSTVEAGMALAVNQVAAAAVGISAGRWADRRGYVGVVVGGGVLGALGHAWLAVGIGPSPSVWSVLLPALVIGGVGSMMIGGTITAAAFRDLDDVRLGRASGSYYVVRRLGSTVGAVAAVAILGEAEGAEALVRFRTIWAFSAACFVASSVTMYGLFDRPALVPTAR